ncbi:MAG TPA: hypothetical protein VKM54_29450 [Myxococcota bacterium]|nr:hypothetical protein [Myxococcota bacterium]
MRRAVVIDVHAEDPDTGERRFGHGLSRVLDAVVAGVRVRQHKKNPGPRLFPSGAIRPQAFGMT